MAEQRGWLGNIVLILVSAAMLCCPAAAARADDAALAGVLAGRVKDAALADVSLGLLVVDVASGDVIFAHKADEPLVPASNMKLSTTAAALLELGADWQFRTLVGTLGDDLVIIGGGDPNLSGRFYDGDPAAAFRQWAAVLKSRGLNHIKGNLVVDDWLFDDEHLHPRWPANQYQLWYVAPVGALTANDSCIDITIRPAAADGAAAAVSLSPATSYFDIRGTIGTRRGGANNPRIDRPRESRTLRLGGTVPLASGAQKYYRTVDDPGLFAGTLILETLRSEGVVIDGGLVRRRVYGEEWTLPRAFRAHLVHTSSLAMSIEVCNTRSQNLYGECILKVLGALGGEGRGIKRQGAWATGNAQVERVLKAAGIDTSGCVFDDGGGLSSANRLTARVVGDILITMARSEHWEVWRRSLAEAGDSDGTLRRWRNEALAGRVHAKTGFLNNARALSGYVQKDDGRWLAFSILANMPYRDTAHAAVRSLQEKVLLDMVNN